MMLGAEDGNPNTHPDMLLVTNALAGSANNYTILRINTLLPKKIESLNLYACLCGRERTNEADNNVAEDFLDYIPIGQVVAADTVLVNWGGRYFFRGCTYAYECSIDEYSQYENDGTDITCIYYPDYRDLLSPLGFVLYTRGDDGFITRDFFSNDVYSCRFYTLGGSSYDGYIVYDYSITERMGNDYNDTFIDGAC